MISRPRLLPSSSSATRTARWWLGLVLVAAVGMPAAATATPRLRNLAFEPSSLTLAPGESRTLRVLGEYDDGTTTDLSSEVVLTSRDPAVVDVSGTTARGLAGGETTIRARHPMTAVDADEPVEVTVLETARSRSHPPRPSSRPARASSSAHSRRSRTGGAAPT